SERTVEPKGPYGTGQPWALTQNVAATPKSWFDCMTAGEKPMRSSAAITWCQRVPASTRNVLAAVSDSQRALLTVTARPSRGRLLAPLGGRAARMHTRRGLAARRLA